jgi:hypothetical protein
MVKGKSGSWANFGNYCLGGFVPSLKCAGCSFFDESGKAGLWQEYRCNSSSSNNAARWQVDHDKASDGNIIANPQNSCAAFKSR